MGLMNRLGKARCVIGLGWLLVGSGRHRPRFAGAGADWHWSGDGARPPSAGRPARIQSPGAGFAPGKRGGGHWAGSQPDAERAAGQHLAVAGRRLITPNPGREPACAAGRCPDANPLSHCYSGSIFSKSWGAAPPPQGESPVLSLRGELEGGLLYLAPDEERRGKLAIISPFVDKSEPVLLTQGPVDIWDYTLAPGGDRVVYTVARPDGRSDLWLVGANRGGSRQLLACPQAACSNASWSADGQLLVYEKRNMPVPGAPPGMPCLWWLDPASGETWPTFDDDRWVGLSPRLSPDGQWLSYILLNSGVLQIHHLHDGRNTLIPTCMGEPVVWSPGGDALLLGDVRYIQETAYIHLLRAEPGSGEVVDLSGEARVFDRAPAWSPDGGWVAFVCRDMGTEGAARGQQIWLMRPDGEQAHPLTADPDFNHDGVAWSPDGRYLAFHRTRLTEQWPLPAVCRLEIETGALRELAAPGHKANWLP